MRSTLFRVAAVAVAVGLYAGSAQAANVSFTGSFATDDAVQLFNFSVGAPSSVTLRTYSYAGGVQANGNVVSAGGFDPILALFDSTGHLITQNDDGGGSVPADPSTGSHFDTFLQSSLGAGNYTVSVMEYDNFANGPNLANGFRRDGLGNFTSTYNCSAGSFCDVNHQNRTNQWAFDILNVSDAVLVDRDPGNQPGNVSAVPIPAALPLLASALAWLGFFGHRRRSA
jgi:hypothetical protein